MSVIKLVSALLQPNQSDSQVDSKGLFFAIFELNAIIELPFKSILSDSGTGLLSSILSNS